MARRAWLRGRRTRFYQFELRGKFAGAKTRLMKALALARAAIEGVEMFTFVVVDARFGRQREPRADHIDHGVMRVPSSDSPEIRR